MILSHSTGTFLDERTSSAGMLRPQMRNAVAMASHLDKSDSKHPEILIVDDDPDTLIALHDLLEAEGYRVTEASTCQEALVRTHRLSFNAVLLDIRLPDGDGLSVLGQLRQANPTLSVIMLTAATSNHQRLNALALGAFSYVAKPYGHHELRHLVRIAIGRTTGSTHPNQAPSQ